MALRFEKSLRHKNSTLLKMQARYDAWQMCRREAEFEALQRYSAA
jgi:plasmid maintenance system antidote protein VapI